MNIERTFCNVIETECGELHTLEQGSEAYKASTDVAAKFADRVIKLKELELEERKIDIEEKKADIELQKMAEERKDRSIKNGIAVGNLLVPAGITIGFGILMFVFEEKGTISSRMGQKILDKIMRK